MNIMEYKAGRVKSSIDGILDLIKRNREAEKFGRNEPNVDPVITMKNIKENLIDIKQVLNEIKFSCFEFNIENLFERQRLWESVQSECHELFKKNSNLENFESCLVQLRSIAEGIGNILRGPYSHQGKLKRKYDQGQSVDLPSMTMEVILNDISPSRDFNILDINCGEGHNLSGLLNHGFSHKALTYGIRCSDYNNETIVKRLTENFERFIYGNFGMNKHITNKVFDIMLVSSTLSFDAPENVSKYFVYQEESGIKKNIKYLREDGIMIYIVPKFRLSREVAAALAKNIRNVNIYEVVSSDTQDIVIVGTRILNGAIDPELYSRLRTFSIYDNIIFKKHNYKIAGNIEEVALFRGKKLNTYEMNAVFNRSGVFDLMEAEEHPVRKGKNCRPILPFSVGQMGLILTSGCLDGIIRDEDGGNHAIKGRIDRIYNGRVETERTASGYIKETRTRICSNHVKIHGFLPTGKLIYLE